MQGFLWNLRPYRPLEQLKAADLEEEIEEQVEKDSIEGSDRESSSDEEEEVADKSQPKEVKHHLLKNRAKALEDRGQIVEEVMDYRTYCETMAGLLQKPIVKLLRNLKVSRNVKWIYQEGISISGRCSLPCFNGKLQ